MPTQSAKPVVQLQTYIGLMFLLLVLLIMSLLAVRFYNQLQDADKSPINNIYLQGERSKTSDQQIRLAISEIAAAGLFISDMRAIMDKVESLPWVYKASVRRQWPDAIIIQIKEQQPIARWNDEGWLNKQGQIFTAGYRFELQHLPKIFAKDQQLEQVWPLLEQIEVELNKAGLILDQLHLNSRDACQVNLANGLILKLGKRDKIGRIARFVASYSQLKQQQQQFDYVDLRYDTGFAVGKL
ncbi:cell division protein FtsQ/DivIB [Paraferrimonas sp. SM1919]|uniref:cell division protein FtsQ/DivIB n=1 Tax=Paraferrimonas sp. SM1919 TaxID=2662263 RepID=UPI0013D055C7|nr:cell division protein FtsQ/DivIB [Paraferrimonas sp. SM1919]